MNTASSAGLPWRSFGRGPRLKLASIRGSAPNVRNEPVDRLILISMLIISILVKPDLSLENSVKDNNDMPGHLARRFQQIAVAVFHAEVEEAGYDLTPVQYAALTTDQDASEDRSSDARRVDRLRPHNHHRRCGSAGAERLAGAPCQQHGTGAPANCRSPMRDGGPSRHRAGGRGGAADHVARPDRRRGREILRLLRKAIAAGNELSRAPQQAALTGAARKK